MVNFFLSETFIKKLKNLTKKELSSIMLWIIEKFFWGPTSIKLDGSGKLYVTESNRHRIQIYEPIGN